MIYNYQSVPIKVYLIQHYIISHDLQLPISAYQGVLDTTLYNKS